MKNSLYTKLSLTLASIFILTASLFLWWTQSVSQVSRAQAEQALHLGLAEHLANDNPLLKQGVYDYKALENLFHTLMVLGPAFEFYFVDPSGKLLTFSAKPGQVKRQFIDLAPLVTLIEDQSNLPIYGDDPRNFDHKKIFSVAPVYNGDTLQGYLYVIIGSSIYIALYLYNKAFTLSSAALVSPMTYLSIVHAGVLGWLIWGYVPSLISVLGMLIVVVCGLLTTLQKA